MEQKKFNIAIIGLGDIAGAHIVGLQRNPKYTISATCDKLPDREKHAQELGCAFFTDYKELAKQDNIDIALILTPPSTHYEIAKTMLQNKKHVLIEKPGVLEIEHLHDLIHIAKENGVSVDVIFHWCYGSEVLYLENNLDQFGKLLRVECNVFDPYTSDGTTITPEKIGLNGAWRDSGINILSMLSCFFDLNEFTLSSEGSQYDTATKLPVYANKKYLYRDIEVSLSIDWRHNRNHKFSNFYFEGGTLFINHTAQDVWLNGKRVASFYTDNRLGTHYENLFRLYDLQNKNLQRTVLLHEILLKSSR